MLDFMHPVVMPSEKHRPPRVRATFSVCRSEDLMIRGGDFYAVWDEANEIWTKSKFRLIDIIDKELDDYAAEKAEEFPDIEVSHLRSTMNRSIDDLYKFCQHSMPDNYEMLDQKLIFADQKPKRSDHATTQLDYILNDGKTPAYDELMSTLYLPEERAKIEWSIGAMISGESRSTQRNLLVLYGAPGTGKSTVINIMQGLFKGYYGIFDARSIAERSSQFAMSMFKDDPILMVQHDGDLSHIEDNTRLNSIVSHEEMLINEKFRSPYSIRIHSFLVMGTNKPVRITDPKSGIIRRLLDANPTGDRLSFESYSRLTAQIPFEYGAIAKKCLDYYLEHRRDYDDYIPIAMMGITNDTYDFVESQYDVYSRDDQVTLKEAWAQYLVYADEAHVRYPATKRQLRLDLSGYFREFYPDTERAGRRYKNLYLGFKKNMFQRVSYQPKEEQKQMLNLDKTESLFDTEFAGYPAQYATKDGIPMRAWSKTKTTLKDLDTRKLHYVKVPENLIVIDFDLKDENGDKCLSKNLEAASIFPPTYAELSKSGKGVHLHYFWEGDVSKLRRIWSDSIEVKVFTGKSSLRRQLTKCNDIPIAHINSGLPLKEKEDKVMNGKTVKTEAGLRKLILRNLNKEIWPNTKPSIDFIYTILDDAYNQGLVYDVSDMRESILSFAAGSTNQANYCIAKALGMKYKSKADSERVPEPAPGELVFFDCEVFPNLFLINWKIQGEGKRVCRMINPKPADIEELLRFKLVGFNNRSYDNHMLYGCLMGYSNIQLYDLSTRLVNSDPKISREAKFGEAFNLSYTDVYDFSAKKQSLKKWEIELGIHHKELGLPWDEPVPESRWIEVAEYCDNDVISTEAVFDHLHDDFVAREILADIAGGTVNDTTNSLTTRIIFGSDKHPELVYTDLATGKASDPAYQRDDIVEAFPGYEFKNGHNMFRGTDLGYGGYVYAEPGMYTNVALLDVASLHPHSIMAMNCFGKYTKNFADIVNARIDIKHHDYTNAAKLFGGKLSKYLDDPDISDKSLAYALKIAINSVYGLTSAKFENPFRDPRNVNNIVALRGALFMKTLQDEVAARGFTVAHVKTDSIKIPDATPEIIQFCMDFAEKYGYQFEHEATYSKICLVNNAVYIAKDSSDGHWTATGKQFQVPYVFKTLFSHEPIEFKDLCETRSVKTAMYLDMNEGLDPQTEAEKELEWRKKQAPSNGAIIFRNPAFQMVSDDELKDAVAHSHNYIFVGRVGQFCPIKPGCGGGLLVRKNGDKYDSVSGAKDYRWLESETVDSLGKQQDIDRTYYAKLVDDAVAEISKYGDFEWFSE